MPGSSVPSWPCHAQIFQIATVFMTPTCPTHEKLQHESDEVIRSVISGLLWGSYRPVPHSASDI